MEVKLEATVRKAVAEAMIKSQYPNMGRPNIPNPPPPIQPAPPSPPSPVRDYQPMEEVRFTNPFAALQNEDQVMTDIYGLPKEHPEADPDEFDDPPPPSPEQPHPEEHGHHVSSEMLDALLKRQFPLLPSPTFISPQQELAARLAVERQESFVAVLPTGGGKSITYTLPAFNPKEAGYRSYIIVPNRALLEDQIKRCKDIGLDSAWWTASRKHIDEDQRLVFLGMESATSQTFKK